MSKNYCLDYLRKEKRIFEKKESYKDVQSDTFYHPYSEDEDKASLEKLAKCLDLLKKNQKEVVDLFYYKKMSYDSISETLSMSWSQIRSLLQNARRNLKKCMKA